MSVAIGQRLPVGKSNLRDAGSASVGCAELMSSGRNLIILCADCLDQCHRRRRLDVVNIAYLNFICRLQPSARGWGSAFRGAILRNQLLGIARIGCRFQPPHDPFCRSKQCRVFHEKLIAKFRESSPHQHLPPIQEPSASRTR